MKIFKEKKFKMDKISNIYKYVIHLPENINSADICWNTYLVSTVEIGYQFAIWKHKKLLSDHKNDSDSFNRTSIVSFDELEKILVDNVDNYEINLWKINDCHATIQRLTPGLLNLFKKDFVSEKDSGFSVSFFEISLDGGIQNFHPASFKSFTSLKDFNKNLLFSSIMSNTEYKYLSDNIKNKRSYSDITDDGGYYKEIRLRFNN